MIVVKDTPNYELRALDYICNETDIQMNGSEELCRYLSYYPYSYPCLVEFYATICRERKCISAIECDKKTAKSIVYPHTNKCSADENPWYKLKSFDDYLPMVEYLKAKHECLTIAHASRVEMMKASEKSEPFLIGYAIHHDNKLIKIFLLKKEQAKSLVYYKRNMEKLEKRNIETWNKNISKKATERFKNNIERLMKTYRREDDIRF